MPYNFGLGFGYGLGEDTQDNDYQSLYYNEEYSNQLEQDSLNSLLGNNYDFGGLGYEANFTYNQSQDYSNYDYPDFSPFTPQRPDDYGGTPTPDEGYQGTPEDPGFDDEEEPDELNFMQGLAQEASGGGTGGSGVGGGTGLPGPGAGSDEDADEDADERKSGRKENQAPKGRDGDHDGDGIPNSDDPDHFYNQRNMVNIRAADGSLRTLDDGSPGFQQGFDTDGDGKVDFRKGIGGNMGESSLYKYTGRSSGGGGGMSRAPDPVVAQDPNTRTGISFDPYTIGGATGINQDAVPSFIGAANLANIAVGSDATAEESLANTLQADPATLSNIGSMPSRGAVMIGGIQPNQTVSTQDQPEAIASAIPTPKQTPEERGLVRFGTTAAGGAAYGLPQDVATMQQRRQADYSRADNILAPFNLTSRDMERLGKAPINLMDAQKLGTELARMNETQKTMAINQFLQTLPDASQDPNVIVDSSTGSQLLGREFAPRTSFRDASFEFLSNSGVSPSQLKNLEDQLRTRPVEDRRNIMSEVIKEVQADPTAAKRIGSVNIGQRGLEASEDNRSTIGNLNRSSAQAVDRNVSFMNTFYPLSTDEQMITANNNLNTMLKYVDYSIQRYDVGNDGPTDVSGRRNSRVNFNAEGTDGRVLSLEEIENLDSTFIKNSGNQQFMQDNDRIMSGADKGKALFARQFFGQPEGDRSRGLGGRDFALLPIQTQTQIYNLFESIDGNGEEKIRRTVQKASSLAKEGRNTLRNSKMFLAAQNELNNTRTLVTQDRYQRALNNVANGSTSDVDFDIIGKNINAQTVLNFNANPDQATTNFKANNSKLITDILAADRKNIQIALIQANIMDNKGVLNPQAVAFHERRAVNNQASDKLKASSANFVGLVNSYRNMETRQRNALARLAALNPKQVMMHIAGKENIMSIIYPGNAAQQSRLTVTDRDLRRNDPGEIINKATKVIESASNYINDFSIDNKNLSQQESDLQDESTMVTAEINTLEVYLRERADSLSETQRQQLLNNIGTLKTQKNVLAGNIKKIGSIINAPPDLSNRAAAESRNKTGSNREFEPFLTPSGNVGAAARNSRGLAIQNQGL